MTEKSSNTVWHQETITRDHREKLNGHQSMILWFTGLSGSGKSTMIHAVEERLHQKGMRTFTLDGDNIRHGLCSDLGFSHHDRQENIRRIGEVAKLCVDGGLIVLAAFISPFRNDRQRVRNLVEPGDFVEVYCKCSLEVCESRDVKGLYRRARAGEIRDFTGISSPYEEPRQPEIILRTDKDTITVCADQVAEIVMKRAAIPGS
ncbi:MAG: adenylyl-sulfate kinase [Magnetococcales bacterium]|nr:adenylyl-sulfate kinase [Magnetococcales bacterium]